MSTGAGARWLWRGAALAVGALQTLAFAPFSFWPLAILCPVFLMWQWRAAPPREAAALGFWFGAGLFGAGTWWLYIPIHTIEAAPLWLTFFLLIALASLMAAYYALLGAVSAWLLPRDGYWRLLAGLPALCLLFEWWRGWFISGFPWLSLGYSLVDSPLRGYAPLLGVYGLSALALWQGAALLALWHGSGWARAGVVAGSALVWIGGSLLTRVDWTVPRSEPVPVAILQGAIPQDEKWQVDNLEPTKARYRAMNDQTTGARLVIWPESAIPELANDYARFLADIQASSQGRGADVIMGVIRLADNGKDYYNSILALTGGVAFYDKRHLVPFSEYQPVPPFLRHWLQFMNLPYADFTAGSELQAPMVAAGLRFAPTVCYEDGFGSAQLALARHSDALVNVTNDAWFGRSPARYQHLQISRMRSLESGRYLLRAANDGISAIVGPHGEVLAMAPEFVPAVLSGTVVPMAGLSPYARAGNWPVLALAWFLAAGAGWRRRAWWGLPLPGVP